MSSPIHPAPINDHGIKTFRPKERCHQCRRYSMTTVLEKLGESEKVILCARCITDRFKEGQEQKVKRLKSYKVTNESDKKE
jgi:hypothetical protein